MCQRGTGHHPDDLLAVVGNGRVSPVAMNRVDNDVGRELDRSRIGLPLAAEVVGDAQSGFALL